MIDKAKHLAANLWDTAENMTISATCTREFFTETASIIDWLVAKAELTIPTALPPGITTELTYINPDGKRYCSLDNALQNLDKAWLIAVLSEFPDYMDCEEQADKLLEAFTITPKQ